ncbi:MAG: putative Ig domain-containing protein [Acidobacteriia bacterium]|nr:putative Ig domain-containing protein [Terriglobia bacterium]
MHKSSVLSVLSISMALFFPACQRVPQKQEVTVLRDGWRFMTGDNPQYARPEYDDSRWVSIRVDQNWDSQGYDKLDGFAWYRLRVVIPSSLTKSSYLKDGLRIFLGKINNFDQSFLNGRVLGINGMTVPADTPLDDSYTKADTNLYDKERIYVIPPNDPRILWDKENVIAVRVFDAGGLGGMYTGDGSLRMVAFPDYLASDRVAQPFVYEGREILKKFSIRNTSAAHTLEGRFVMRATDKLSGRELSKSETLVRLRPNASRDFTIKMASTDHPAQMECTFTYEPTGEKSAWQEEVPYILTPAPSEEPKINGAGIVGARPGRPFLHAVAATGKRPLTYGAKGLPAGLTLDPATGIISGRTSVRGEYRVVLAAENALGKTERVLTMVIGDRIALTPPMGWNSWNAWGLTVDQNKVLASAQTFKNKGFQNHGWTYINVDDGWEIKGDSPAPKRKANGDIIANERFPDMKALGDRIHALGLKFGIYSSPGPLTCGGYAATYQHEGNDARSWAAWGIDYLKYDWCSYDKIARDNSRAELMKPYQLMRRHLDQIDRDIIYSLCQYGMGKVWEWGAEAGGNLWRTTEDITDTWESLKSIGFSQTENATFAGPGRWNDPDMLVVGWVGWGPSLHPTRLTPDEQYTHISLWCLLSAPLLIGCDLERLDDFTLNLLTNDEVLALDQDPLGRQAVPKITEDAIQVWVKELADGGRAVGIFNLSEGPKDYALDLGKLGYTAPVRARDVWRQRNTGEFKRTIPARVPAHGVVLWKLTQ